MDNLHLFWLSRFAWARSVEENDVSACVSRKIMYMWRVDSVDHRSFRALMAMVNPRTLPEPIQPYTAPIPAPDYISSAPNMDPGMERQLTKK
jgi:hypothetical protein